uniref:Uncharacterized protein n=1 Tax=Caulobacter sp. (strain K31) TaxID=366602 RepID=B0T4Y0_CAUSK
MIGHRPARNIIAGVLAGFGASTFLFFIIADVGWFAVAPLSARPGLGLIYPHNEHGSVGYFSAFHTATCTILPMLAALLFFVGWRIVPKKNIRVRSNKLSMSMQFDPDDPERVLGWSQLAGFVLAPAILYGVGQPLLRALTAKAKRHPNTNTGPQAT